MNNNRSDKNDLSSLGNAFSRLYATQKWKHQWWLFRLAQDWPEIVGKEIARLTAPVLLRQSVLWIAVQDSAWMHHLQFIKLDLLTRVNKAHAEQPVTDIRWMLQPVMMPRPEHYPPASHAVAPEQARSFRRMTESVANQECREALLRLWQAFAAHTE